MAKSVQSKAQKDNKVVAETFYPRLNRKSIAAVSIVLIVVAIVIVIAIDHKSTKVAPMTPQHLASIELPQAVSSLVTQRKYNQALETISSSMDPQSETSMMLSAEVYSEQGHFSQALSIYETIAQKWGLNESLAVTIAQTAHYSGDNKTAITYYQKAVVLLQAQPSNAQDPQEISNLQTTIQGLQ